MKMNIHKFLVFGVLLFVILGCSSFMDGVKKGMAGGEPQIMTSTDGTYQLTVPGNWSKQTDLNSVATLQTANPREELYAIVIKESKSEFPSGTTIDSFAELAREGLKTNVVSPVITPAVPAGINGYSARQFEASGTVAGLQAKYLYAVVETSGSFYQIMTWTLANRYDDNKQKLQNVINSFVEKM
jgi:hypothetical protein